jgi:hypothetical protein
MPLMLHDSCVLTIVGASGTPQGWWPFNGIARMVLQLWCSVCVVRKDSISWIDVVS